MTTEKIRHADLVAFTRLKSLAFAQRFERKDAHDLVYCIEHAPGGMDTVAASFQRELTGKHSGVVGTALSILGGRFVGDPATEGYKKEGPVSVAKFELGDAEDAGVREQRLLHQRQVSDVIERLMAKL